MLYLVRPRAVIDGREYVLAWGTPAFLPLAPGRHSVEIYFNYLGFRCGRKSVELDVPPDGVLLVRYRSLPLPFTPGVISVERLPG